MPIIMVPSTPTAGTSYATLSDLSAFLGVTEALLSEDSSRLLVRASELMDYYTLSRYNTDNIDVLLATQTAAMKKATCAQVEYWVNQGEDSDINRAVKGYSVGKVGVQFADGATQSRLAPRARQYLLSAGLLYCGASASRGGGPLL